jgi:flagellar basal-body rod protein FlgF
MDDALHAAASAMTAVMRQLEAAAANAVHARTPGYQNRVAVTRSFATALDAQLGREASLVSSSESTSFDQGMLVKSDAPYSVALRGPGFLAVQTPDGTAYTRNGDLALAADGTLMTRSGYPVLGAAGPIRSDPAGVAPTLDPKTGALLQGEQELGTLRVVEFERRDRLVRAGDTLFLAPPEAIERRAESTEIVAGMLELAPERAVAGMVGLIGAHRDFEAAQRVMSVINRTYERLRGQGG